MKPTWNLDLDGVINGFGRCGWHAPPRQGNVHANGFSWPMRWSPELVDRICALHRSGLVQILWATTWIEVGTDGIEELLGLPAFPHAYARRPYMTHHEAKFAAADDVITTGGRLIWTDDEVVPLPGTPEYDYFMDAGALLIRPDGRRGLRPEDLDLIETYIELCHS